MEENNNLNDKNYEEVITENTNESEVTTENEAVNFDENSTKKQNKGPIIFLILTIVIIIGASTFAILNKKSKVEKFIEVLTDDYMFEFVGEMAPYTYKQGKVVSSLEVNPEALKILLEAPELTVNRMALVSEQNVEGFDSSGKLYIDMDNVEIASIKYAKTDDAIGFAIPDLINEYIVIKNENLKDLARKFGMSGDELEAIPDKITISEIKELLTNTKEDDEDTLDLETVLEKYKEPVHQYLEERIMIIKKQNIDIKEETLLTTKYSIGLTETESYELIKILLDILKEDVDLYNVLKEESLDFVYETFEEWQKDVNKLIEDVEKNLVDADNELDIIILSAYTKFMDTVAIELEFPLQTQKIRVATVNNKNEYYTEISGLFFNEDINIVIESLKEEDTYEGSVSLVALGTDEENSNFNLINYSIEYYKEPELEKLDLTKDFVLNNETEESIKNKFEEIQMNLWKYIITIVNRMPEDSGDSTDNNIMEEAEFSEENQVFILEDSNKLFESVEYGMTEEEVMKKIGGLPVEEKYGETKYLRWEDEYYNSFDVIFENGTVVGASRILFSDAYSNIKLSSELGTEIEDLNIEIEKIKEGMTLEEVIGILGDKYFQSYKSITKEASYEWYDKAENNVVIDFDENGKVFLIGDVMNFF